MKLKVKSEKLIIISGKGVAFCALLLLAVSCSLHKKLVIPVERMEDFEWMTAKLSIDFNSADHEFHFNHIPGVMRMRRDSVIWATASLYGMEVGRIRITNDSLVLINRNDNTYIAEPLDKATALSLPNTYNQWQNLLLKGKTDQVELQMNAWNIRIRYSDIKLDEPQTFPIKINQKYERIKL